MEHLSQQGFEVITYFDATGYPTDGEGVFRVDSYEAFYRMGYTAHHPRGAWALKEQKAGVKLRINSMLSGK